MGGCDFQTFSGITLAHFACLLQKAQSTGKHLRQERQRLAGRITITWNYDPAAQLLTIQCIDKPVFLGCGVITSQIRDLVNNCAGS